MYLWLYEGYTAIRVSSMGNPVFTRNSVELFLSFQYFEMLKMKKTDFACKFSFSFFGFFGSNIFQNSFYCHRTGMLLILFWEFQNWFCFSWHWKLLETTYSTHAGSKRTTSMITVVELHCVASEIYITISNFTSVFPWSTSIRPSYLNLFPGAS